MICHHDKSFCSASGHCAKSECYRWIDCNLEYDLPICMVDFKTDDCGYIENPILTVLKIATGEK